MSKNNLKYEDIYNVYLQLKSQEKTASHFNISRRQVRNAIYALRDNVADNKNNDASFKKESLKNKDKELAFVSDLMKQYEDKIKSLESSIKSLEENLKEMKSEMLTKDELLNRLEVSVERFIKPCGYNNQSSSIFINVGLQWRLSDNMITPPFSHFRSNEPYHNYKSLPNQKEIYLFKE